MTRDMLIKSRELKEIERERKCTRLTPRLSVPEEFNKYPTFIFNLTVLPNSYFDFEILPMVVRSHDKVVRVDPTIFKGCRKDVEEEIINLIRKELDVAEEVGIFKEEEKWKK